MKTFRLNLKCGTAATRLSVYLSVSVFLSAYLPLGLRHHILRKPKLHAEATIDVLAKSPSFSCQTYE